MRAGDVFRGSYLKADDLQGRTIKVTIENVTMEDIGQGEKKERRAVAHFEGKDKGFVLNKTNWNILEEVCGSQDSDDWRGYTVTLYVTKVDFNGQRVAAIRVSDQPGSTVPPAHAMPPPQSNAAITDDDIPFSWVLPLVLPVLGALSYAV